MKTAIISKEYNTEFANNIVINGRSTLDENGEITGGNSTERALFGALKLNHNMIESIYRSNRVMSRIPFNSAHKFSATTVKKTNGTRTYVMGAPEIILKYASRYIDTDGSVHSIQHAKIQQLMLASARQTMRVVATAYYDGAFTGNKIPDNLVFIALSIMRDEVRPGVVDAVNELRKSGVQVMMITGDNLETARVIAGDSGIISGTRDIAINASEFDSMPDARARRMLPKIRVIARATPYSKLRVVELARQDGLCIGMCGDGTNDAPALRAADVGFAMGDSTDVCKGASDIIIVDNNFISITNSILMGRTFMHNVISFLRFQLPINFMLVAISILFPIFLGMDAIMAVHILIINIIIDSLNSLAFGGEPSRPEYMSEPVVGKNTPLITRETIRVVLWTTVMCVFIFALMATPAVRNIFGSGDVYTSARFSLLIILAMLNGFCVRAPGYNILEKISSNPMFLWVAGFVFVGTYLCVTFGGASLHLAPMGAIQWFVVIGLGMMIIPLNMLYRVIKN
ncbi:MAG: HAD-IC family P-type ATPase [Alphaproteobacteria bacterium]